MIPRQAALARLRAAARRSLKRRRAPRRRRPEPSSTPAAAAEFHEKRGRAAGDAAERPAEAEATPPTASSARRERPGRHLCPAPRPRDGAAGHLPPRQSTRGARARRDADRRRARARRARRMEAAIGRARGGRRGVDHYDAAWVADSVKEASCPRRSRTASRAPCQAGRGTPVARRVAAARVAARPLTERPKPKTPASSTKELKCDKCDGPHATGTAPSSRVIGMTPGRAEPRADEGLGSDGGRAVCGRRASSASRATARASSTAWRTGCGMRASRTTTTGGCAKH